MYIKLRKISWYCTGSIFICYLFSICMHLHHIWASIL